MEKRRKKQRILFVVMLVVSATLVLDGYLLGRFFTRRAQVAQCRTEPNCVVPKPLIRGQAGSPQVSGPVDIDALLGAQYYHDVLALTINYPENWGEVVIANDYGRQVDGQEVVVGMTASLAHDQGDGAVFLHATNTNRLPFSRTGYYWGSGGENIKSEEDVLRWCDYHERCDTFFNNWGLLVARVKETVELSDGASYERVLYYFNNPAGPYNGVVMSAERLGVDEDEFRKVVNEIKPLVR